MNVIINIMLPNREWKRRSVRRSKERALVIIVIVIKEALLFWIWAAKTVHLLDSTIIISQNSRRHYLYSKDSTVIIPHITHLTPTIIVHILLSPLPIFCQIDDVQDMSRSVHILDIKNWGLEYEYYTLS